MKDRILEALCSQESGLKGSGVPEVDFDGRAQGTRRVRQYNL